MKRLSSSDARKHFPDLIKRAAYAKKRTVVTSRGKELAAIVSMEDLHLLQALEDRFDIEAARRELADAEKQGTISWEDLKSELDL